MITQELINGRNLGQFILEFLPIRLQYIARHEPEHMLDPLKHLRSQDVDSSFPSFEIWSSRGFSPFGRLVFGPHVGQGKLEVSQAEEETKDELVPCDGFA